MSESDSVEKKTIEVLLLRQPPSGAPHPEHVVSEATEEPAAEVTGRIGLVWVECPECHRVFRVHLTSAQDWMKCPTGHGPFQLSFLPASYSA